MNKSVFVWLVFLLAAACATAQVTTDGSTTLNSVPYFKNSATQLSNSPISVSGSNVGIGTTPSYPMDVNGALRATGLVTDASLATTWVSWVNTNISANGQAIFSVSVSGSNSTWTGVFLVQGTNSYTPTSIWNNVELLSWSGYNAAANDVQAFIMSNTAPTSWGASYLVFQINGRPGAGQPATLNVTALGSNVSQLNLVNSPSQPYTYQMASSFSTHQITETSTGVGINTTSPSQTLEVNGTALIDQTLTVNNAIKVSAELSQTDGYDYTQLAQKTYGASHGILFGAYKAPTQVTGGLTTVGNTLYAQDAGTYGYGAGAINYAAYAGEIDFLISPQSTGAATSVNWGTPVMSLRRGGNVGIGTTSPTAKLEVNGGLRFTGDTPGTVQTTAWTGVLCGGDYAEAVDPVGSKEAFGPGDVLVITDGDKGDIQKSMQPYATTVAGVFATKPGVVGRRQTLPDTGEEIPMAMVGIVPTKVTAENGPIHRGDLLVTSSQSGYAMKGTDRNRMLGAVIGKAMGSLESGSGVIEVLVTLQ